jgi:flagellar assembly protein FliH
MSGPMPPATRYLFDRSFEAGHAPAPPTPETADPALVLEPEAAADNPAIYTQEDLDRVRSEALSFGRKQGAAEAAEAAEQRAEQRADQQLARTLEQIAEGLGAIVDALRQGDAQQAKAAAMLGLGVVRKLFPETSRRYGLTEITGVIESVIGRITDKPRLTVRVAESLQPEIAGKVDAIAELHGFSGQISIIGDGSVAEGDCRVAWAGGGATRDSAALWREIDAAVDRTLGPIEHPADSSVEPNAGPGADEAKLAHHDACAAAVPPFAPARTPNAPEMTTPDGSPS